MSATIIETLTEKLRVRTQELMAAEDKMRKMDREFQQLAEDEARLEAVIENSWRAVYYNFPPRSVYCVYDANGRLLATDADFRSAIDAAMKGGRK